MSNLGKRKVEEYTEEEESEFLKSLPKAPKQELTEAQIMDVVNQLVDDASAKPAAQASRPRKKKTYRKKNTYRKKYYRSSRYERYTRPMVYPTLLPPMPVMPYPPNISSVIPPQMQPSPMMNPSICHPAAQPYYGGAPPNPWGYR